MGSKTRFLNRAARGIINGRVVQANKRLVLLAFNTSFDLGPKQHWSSAEAKLARAVTILGAPRANMASMLISQFIRIKMHETSSFTAIFGPQDEVDRANRVVKAMKAEHDAAYAEQKRQIKKREFEAKCEAIKLLATPYDPAIVYKRSELHGFWGMLQ